MKESKIGTVIGYILMGLYALFLAAIGYIIANQFIENIIVSMVCGALFSTSLLLWAKVKSEEIEKRNMQ